MRSYNFRHKFEDRSTGFSIAAVHRAIKEYSEQGGLFDIKELLAVVRQNLVKYYKYDKTKSELYEGDLSVIRASEIYCMYLHSLIYHLVHNVTPINKNFSMKIINEILADKFIVFTSNFDKIPEVVLWFDEETYCTAVIQLSRENYDEQLMVYLKILSGLPRLHDVNLKKYLLNQDKRGKSALMYAAASGHDGICDRLLEFMMRRFGLDTLKDLLSLKDKRGKTALQLATDKDHTDAAAIISTYQGRLKLNNNVELSPSHQLFGGNKSDSCQEPVAKKLHVSK